MRKIFDIIFLTLVGCVIIGVSYITVNPNNMPKIIYSQDVLNLESLVNYKSTSEILISISGGAYLGSYDGKCHIKVLEPVDENKKIILDTLNITDDKNVVFERAQYTYYQIEKSWSDFGRALSSLNLDGAEYMKNYGATTWYTDIAKNKVIVEVNWLNFIKAKNLSNLIKDSQMLKFHFTIGEPYNE